MPPLVFSPLLPSPSKGVAAESERRGKRRRRRRRRRREGRALRPKISKGEEKKSTVHQVLKNAAA